MCLGKVAVLDLVSELGSGLASTLQYNFQLTPTKWDWTGINLLCQLLSSGSGPFKPINKNLHLCMVLVRIHALDLSAKRIIDQGKIA